MLFFVFFFTRNEIEMLRMKLKLVYYLMKSSVEGGDYHETKMSPNTEWLTGSKTSVIIK